VTVSRDPVGMAQCEAGAGGAAEVVRDEREAAAPAPAPSASASAAPPSADLAG